jgi:uncharacterized protein (TIGR03437 family)
VSNFFRNLLAAFILILPASAVGQPMINAVINNFSGTLPGLPNYGIAPASLFVIYGSGLCASAPLVTQTSAETGLPQKLNGMTISVTVNGVTTTPAIYYAIPTQVAAVLPSTTPVGTGTITVSYNGQSNSAPLQVTKTAFGILTTSLTGSGPIKATNLEYQDITPTASAAPGQTIILWGSGLGADTANNDRTYPMKQDNLNDATVYIGGVKATVLYAGRSLFPGEDQIDVTVPDLGASPAFDASKDHDGPRASSGFLGGCGNSVVVVSNGIPSNFGTLAVTPGGGTCSDPELGTTGTEVGTGTVKSGSVSLVEINELKQPSLAATSLDYASAEFQSQTVSQFTDSSAFFSFGSCIVTASSASSTSTTATSTGLDAGTPIVLTGGGLNLNLPETATSGPGLGSYYAALTSAPSGGTSYTFKGPGGKDVGPFTATITLPSTLTWTNEDSISTITESKGQLITWSGGAPGTYVIIIGYSSSPTLSLSVAFDCLAPVSDGQFTIPPYVLLALPADPGELAVYNFADPVSFTATGIDSGHATVGVISLLENVNYQ